MRHRKSPTIAMRVAIAIVSSAISVSAIAAPYSIEYLGQVSLSAFPEIQTGQGYTVRLVFDNGGVSAANQTWDQSHLTCIIWTMNYLENVRFVQDLSMTQGTLSAAGAITTDAGGALASNFSSLVSTFPNVGTYSTVGFAPVPPIEWFLNDINNVFYDDARSFGDAAGGVQMAVDAWTDPTPYEGGCSVTSVSSNRYQPVPTLSEWAAFALSGLLGLGGIFAMRRRVRRVGPTP